MAQRRKLIPYLLLTSLMHCLSLTIEKRLNLELLHKTHYSTVGIWSRLQVSITMKRHHDHSMSYKGKHLIEWRLTVERFSLLSPWCRMAHAGRHSAGEEAVTS